MAEQSLTVVATQKGHYGGILRTPGTPSGTFTLDDPMHFSHRWMARMGTEQAEAFHANVQHRREIDHLTGERIAAGGVHEALSIALEENERLKREIAELKNGTVPRPKRDPKPEPEDEGDPDGGEPELPLAPDDEDDDTGTTKRRRRRST